MPVSPSRGSECVYFVCVVGWFNVKKVVSPSPAFFPPLSKAGNPVELGDAQNSGLTWENLKTRGVRGEEGTFLE